MSQSNDSFPRSDRSRIRRLHEYAHYDKAAVFAVLDSNPMCHVGYAIEGQPYVTPTLHWRAGETVYWHGSSASRMLRAVAGGLPVCLTVTNFDGFVLARSSFNHAANYRTAMLYGTARPIEDPVEKEAALEQMMEGLFPGRWRELRGNTAQELKATTVVAMTIDDAVAKVVAGPPEDDEEDYRTATCWAGVLPRREVWDVPEADPRLAQGTPVPDYLTPKTDEPQKTQNIGKEDE